MTKKRLTFVALVAFYLIPFPAFTQSVRDVLRWPGMGCTYINPLTFILEHQNNLALSQEQKALLMHAEGELQKAILDKQAHLDVAEIEFNDLYNEPSLDFKKMEKKLLEIEKLRTDLEIFILKKLEMVRREFSDKQREQIRSFGIVPLACNTNTLAEPEINRKIQRALEDRYKDQHMVDLETTEVIKDKIIDWVELIGGIVLAAGSIFAALLAFLGYRSYKDVLTKVIKRLGEKGQALMSQSITRMEASYQDRAEKMYEDKYAFFKEQQMKDLLAQALAAMQSMVTDSSENDAGGHTR